MKTLFLTLSLILVLVAFVTGQNADTTEKKLTDAQWKPLFSALSNEDWKQAFDLSSTYLDQLKNDDNAKSIANLRYMYLYSAAGEVSEGKMTFEDLEKKISIFAGKKIVLPFREISNACQTAFNIICGSTEEKKRAFITASNKTATTIHSFEYIELAEDFDFAKNSGKKGAVLGTVKAIVPNPNKSRAIVMRIYISDAKIQLADPK